MKIYMIYDNEKEKYHDYFMNNGMTVYTKRKNAESAITHQAYNRVNNFKDQDRYEVREIDLDKYLNVTVTRLKD